MLNAMQMIQKKINKYFTQINIRFYNKWLVYTFIPSHLNRNQAYVLS